MSTSEPKGPLARDDEKLDQARTDLIAAIGHGLRLPALLDWLTAHRWARWLFAIGCLLFVAGLLLLNEVLGGAQGWRP